MMEGQERSYKPSELEVGKIYEESELIIDNDGGDMVTLRHEEGIGEGFEYNMMIFRYDLVQTPKGRIIPHLNGRNEVAIDDEDNSRLFKQLNDANLW